MFNDGVEPKSLPICEPASPGDLRFKVGRSGSSPGELPLPFGDAVSDVVLPELEAVSDVRRFIVGLSGSSAGASPPLFAELVSVVELPEDDPELVSEVRRFIVGLSGSSADELPDPAAPPVEPVVVALPEPLPPACTGFPLLSEKCGFESDAELEITGSVFEGRSGALFLAITGGL